MYYSKFYSISSILVVLLCVVIAVPYMAKAESPISIEADQMSSTEETNTVLFTGDVDAKQGDLRVRSDKMTVYYTDQDTDAKEQLSTTQQVEKLICVGNVEITRTDWLGTSDNMVYFADKRQVILTGNAKAWQGQNMVVGEKIVYYMDEGRSEVVGGTAVSVGGEEEKEKKSRVKMTILQK